MNSGRESIKMVEPLALDEGAGQQVECNKVSGGAEELGISRPLLAIPLDLHHKDEDEDEDTCAPSIHTNDIMNSHGFKLHSQENTEDSMNVAGGGLGLSGSGHDESDPAVATTKESNQIDQPMLNDEQQHQTAAQLSTTDSDPPPPVAVPTEIPDASTETQAKESKMEIEIPSEPPKESSPAPPTTPTAQIVNPATNPELITPEELRAILIEMSGNGFQALAKSCPTLHSVVIRLLSGGKPVPPATSTGRITRSSTAARSVSSSGKGGWKPSERVQRRLRKPVPIPVLKKGEIPIDPSLSDPGGTIAEVTTPSTRTPSESRAPRSADPGRVPSPPWSRPRRSTTSASKSENYDDAEFSPDAKRRKRKGKEKAIEEDLDEDAEGEPSDLTEEQALKWAVRESKRLAAKQNKGGASTSAAAGGASKSSEQSGGSLSEPESDGSPGNATSQNGSIIIAGPGLGKAAVASRHKTFEYEDFMDPNFARIFAGAGALPPPLAKRPFELVWDGVPYSQHLTAFTKTMGWTDEQLRFPLLDMSRCPMNAPPVPCPFTPGSRNHFRRHLTSHLPFGVGYFFCCPLCNTPTSRGDNFKRHLAKCNIWTRGPRPRITEMQLKTAYNDNIWLRVPHTAELDRDILEQTQQRVEGKLVLPLEHLIAEDLQAEQEEPSTAQKRKKRSVGKEGPTKKARRGD